MKITRLFLPLIIAVSCATPVAFADSGIPKDYPLKRCPVSDEELGGGDMKPFKVTYEGTDIWLCCKNCKKDFDKQPAKFAQTVKDAAAKK